MTTTAEPASKRAGNDEPEDAYKVDTTLDLKALRLTHAPGNDCTCAGVHPVALVIDLADHDLHRDGECDDPAYTGDIDDALQALHEKAHPDGTVFVGRCREPECVTLREVLA